MKRYCILTLPRSGSQLCEHILINNNLNSFRLSEMFEGWYPFDFSLKDNKIHKVVKNNNVVNVSLNDKISDDWEYKLDLLDKAENTDYSLRIFLINYRNLYVQKTIINHLKKLNFVFVSLQRNYEDMILSNLIAKFYAKKSINIYGMGTKISKKPIYLPLKEELYPCYMASTFFLSKLFWYERLHEIVGVGNYHTVDYETIYNDCEKILGTKVEKIQGKTLESDPYDYIINKDEVRELLRPYVEKLKRVN